MRRLAFPLAMLATSFVGWLAATFDGSSDAYRLGWLVSCEVWFATLWLDSQRKR